VVYTTVRWAALRVVLQRLQNPEREL